MVCVIQRVKRASVSVAGSEVGKCGEGLLLLVCAKKGDDADTAVRMADKVVRMRIFEDGDGKMNLSVTDIGGQALCVSNFTLCASCRRGTRPDFFAAEKPPLARELYETFVEAVRAGGVPTETGEFGEDMSIDCSLDGPVTIILDSEKDLAQKN